MPLYEMTLLTTPLMKLRTHARLDSRRNKVKQYYMLFAGVAED